MLRRASIRKADSRAAPAAAVFFTFEYTFSTEPLNGHGKKPRNFLVSTVHEKVSGAHKKVSSQTLLLVGEVEARKPHYLVASGQQCELQHIAAAINCASDTPSRRGGSSRGPTGVSAPVKMSLAPPQAALS